MFQAPASWARRRLTSYSMPLVVALVLGGVAWGQAVLTEDFSTDGDGDRYTMILRGIASDEPHQGWEHTFNLAGREPGGAFTVPQRRVTIPWDSDVDGTEFSESALSIVDAAIQWAAGGTAGPLNLTWLANNGIQGRSDLDIGDQFLYDRLVSQGHTIQLLDSSNLNFSPDTNLLLISDSVDESRLTGQLRNLDLPIVNYEVDLNGELLLASGGGMQTRRQIQIRDAAHPVLGGVGGVDEVIDWTVTGQSLPSPGSPFPGVSVLATFMVPEFTQVTNLATVDAMIEGRAGSQQSTGQISEADLFDVVEGAAGNWFFDYPIPGGGGDDYAIVGVGTLTINQSGDFTFALGGDDGGRLRIDGQDVIVDDTTHAFGDTFQTINLSAGDHTFEWVGFERGGGAGFELSIFSGASTGPVSEAAGWDVVAESSLLPEVNLSGPIDVTAYYLDIASSPGISSDQPAVLALEAGTVVDVPGSPFKSADGHYLLAEDLDDGQLPDPALPKGVQFPAVDVSGMANPRIQLGLAAAAAVFEDSDFVRIIVDPDGAGPAPEEVVTEFIGGGGSFNTLSDGQFLLTPHFKNVSYPLPAGSTNAQVRIEVSANDNGELVGVDRIRITDGPTGDPVYPEPPATGFQQGVNGYNGTVDTIVRFAQPDADLSDEVGFSADGDDGGGPNHVLIRFEDIFGDEPGLIPTDQEIESATLSFQVMNAGNELRIHRMLQPWDDTDTWNSLGDGVQTDDVEAVATPEDTTGGNVPVGELRFDVTESLRIFQEDPSQNFGWVILPTGTDGVDFLSEDVAELVDPRELLAPRLDFVLSSVVMIPGDLDADGDVDTADLNTMILSWTGALEPGTGSATPEQGDLDGDMDVDTADLNSMILAWTGARAGSVALSLGAGSAAEGAAAAQVPEPQSVVLLLMGAALVAGRRLRRRRHV